MQSNESSHSSGTNSSSSRGGSVAGEQEKALSEGDLPEFAEPIPAYLRSGYQALMHGNGYAALKEWQQLFDRYPSAEVCSHIARVHYYQTYFLGHGLDHPKHCDHITEMRTWAERAIKLNPHSAIGHAMLAAALGRQAQLCGSQRLALSYFREVREHAEHAILIDDGWVGHFVMGIWHREIASIHPGLRALAGLFRAKLPDGSFVDSIKHFREVLRQYPENNTIYAEMGRTYERAGDVEQAVQMYRRCCSMPLFRHPLARYLTDEARQRLIELE